MRDKSDFRPSALPLPRQQMDASLESDMQYHDAHSADTRRALYDKADPARNIWREAVVAADLDPQTRLLDIGSGSGYFIKMLLEHGHQGPVLGIDKFANQFYGVVLKINKDYEGANVLFMEGDAQNLHFKDNEIEAAASNFIWYHLPDAEAAALEMKRVVAKDGLVIVSSRNEANLDKLWVFADQAARLVGARRFETFYSRCNVDRTREIMDREFEIIAEDYQESPLVFDVEIDEETGQMSRESEWWLKYKAAFISIAQSMVDDNTGEKLSDDQMAAIEAFADDQLYQHLSEQALFYYQRDGRAYFVDTVSQAYFVARNSKKPAAEIETKATLAIAKTKQVKPIELVVSDWDDVWTEGSTYAYFECYKAAVKGVGINLSDEEIRARMNPNWGKRHEVILADILKDQPDLVRDAIEVYEEELLQKRTFENNLVVRKGAAELIGRLAARTTLTIVSGSHPEILKRVLHRIGINHDPENLEISQIITGYDVPDMKGKPDPYSARQIMRDQQISPQRTLVIGDSPNDLMMGRQAHTRTAAVLTGHLKSEEEARQYGADFVIESIDQIEDEVLDTAA